MADRQKQTTKVELTVFDGLYFGCGFFIAGALASLAMSLVIGTLMLIGLFELFAPLY